MDQESDNSNGQQRRRIPIACTRCRKRKIKCSGDPGDGRGCQNCRTSGCDPAECKFERMSSIAMDFHTPANDSTPFFFPDFTLTPPQGVYHSADYLGMNGHRFANQNYVPSRCYAPASTTSVSGSFSGAPLEYVGSPMDSTTSQNGYSSTNGQDMYCVASNYLPPLDNRDADTQSAHYLPHISEPAAQVGLHALNSNMPASVNSFGDRLLPEPVRPTALKSDNMSAFFGTHHRQSISSDADTKAFHTFKQDSDAGSLYSPSANVSQWIAPTAMEGSTWQLNPVTEQSNGRQVSGARSSGSKFKRRTSGASNSPQRQTLPSMSTTSRLPMILPATNPQSPQRSNTIVRYGDTSGASAASRCASYELPRQDSSLSLYSFSSDQHRDKTLPSAGKRRKSGGGFDPANDRGTLVSGHVYSPLVHEDRSGPFPKKICCSEPAHGDQVLQCNMAGQVRSPTTLESYSTTKTRGTNGAN